MAGARGIPGPPARPVVGHLHLLKKPLHRSLAALAARHGGGAGGLLLLRFGARPVLLVSSPAAACECFTAHDVALAGRPGLASRRLLPDDCPAIATASYGPLWRRLRRLDATAAARDAGARDMVGKLWRAGPGSVAVKATAYEFVVNVITAMVAGKRMQQEEVLRLKAMTEAAHAATGAANRHDFIPVLRLLDLGRTARKLAALAKERHQFGQSLCSSEAETPRTVIGDLLREQERSPEPLDDVVIRTVCLSLLQGGTDTSSSTIETAEIISTVGTSRLLQESDLANMPYLRCIVTETLWLHPVAPNLPPHEASRGFTVAGGHAIGRGTVVLVDRDPRVWDEPEKFTPERFLEAKVDDDEGTRWRWMMPFGMGRRRCPGEGLALRTVGVALGVMVQCFEWERGGREEVDLSEGSAGITMPMAMPLMAM
ncbi:hypothetical protein PVAP13_3NG304018 [Panicum virgatum]|uniref:Cytochrome P450 n=1 Tax=Panicum virgatum TaxID=38727 RepID=A0A8T0UKX2_PANVG|nr:hypothetical protein PVAP13_3NG304018 [Panicum virgatum]